MQQGMDDLDRIEDAAIPLLGAMSEAGFGTDVVVVGLALVDRMLRQFKVGRECTVAEHRAAHAVPSVSITSSPRPATIPRPCTSASLSRRAGLPKRRDTACSN